MLKNYLLVAVRNLYRNKYYALINIAGLGVAMAICVVGYVNYRFSRSFDAFHENIDSVHVLGSYVLRDGERQDMFLNPTPLASALHENVPGVVAGWRWIWRMFATATGSLRKCCVTSIPVSLTCSRFLR